MKFVTLGVSVVAVFRVLKTDLINFLQSKLEWENNARPREGSQWAGSVVVTFNALKAMRPWKYIQQFTEKHCASNDRSFGNRGGISEHRTWKNLRTAVV